MTLVSTIEVNDGTVTLTGIIVALSPTYDPNAVQELWRGPDSAGAPDTANAVRIASLSVPAGGLNYVDRLPTDGVTWWYRTRMTGGPYGDSAYSDWVKLGTADRLSKDAAVSVGSVGAAAASPAWTQANARIGPQGNLLPNPGFEDGLAFWLSAVGTMTAVNTPANANGGNWYLQLTSTTGVAAQAVAADDASRSRYFEVNTNDVVQFGGWLYRESGTANVRYVLELTDKDKGSATLYTTPNQNTAAWLQVQGQQIVGAGKKYARVWAEIDATGTGVVARVDDAYLRIALGAIYDVPPPNTLYEIRFANAVADPDTVDGLQSYIDFPATTNFQRIGQTPKAIVSSTSATPIVVTVTGHGYTTGDAVVIRGHLTNTAANGSWKITVTGANTFSLDTSVGNGVGGATGHVVKLSLTIDNLGNLVVYGVVRASSFVASSAAAFTGLLQALGGFLVRNTLQHSTTGNYGDTTMNRVLLEDNNVKVVGDAQASGGENNEAVRLGSHIVSTGAVLTARSTVNSEGAAKGWRDPTGADGFSSISVAGGADQFDAAANRIYCIVGDPNVGDAGTATGSQTSTTLQDTSKTWTVNAFTGQEVRITGGTGVGQTRTISSNTANTLTVPAWGTTPDGTSTYVIGGANPDAYDDKYTIGFKVTADIGTLTGIEKQMSASVTVEVSTDDGLTWSGISGSWSASTTSGISAVSYTPNVVITGAPASLRIRLVLEGIAVGTGGSGTAKVQYFSTVKDTNNYSVTWTTSAGSTKARRGLKAYATSDGTDQQPHAYLEPLTAATPDANGAEGEIEYVGSPMHALLVHDAAKFCRIPRVLFSDANKATTNTVEGSLTSFTLKANTLGTNGQSLAVIITGQAVGGTSGTVKVKLNGATTFFALTVTAGNKFSLYGIITRTTGAAVQVGVALESQGAAVTANERTAGTENMAADMTFDIRGIVVGACTLTVDGVTVLVL